VVHGSLKESESGGKSWPSVPSNPPYHIICVTGASISTSLNSYFLSTQWRQHYLHYCIIEPVFLINLLSLISYPSPIHIMASSWLSILLCHFLIDHLTCLTSDLWMDMPSISSEHILSIWLIIGRGQKFGEQNYNSQMTSCSEKQTIQWSSNKPSSNQSTDMW
jgi:hypothetical protein